uniref:Ig-like domain-containing protein n=1 Tax=Amphiprion percula TaxID=161767 RepID=A0A3P8SR86_AMPPE
MGSMNTIKQESTEQVVAEGRNIKLTCEYDGSIYNIQWYRQFQRSRPEFLTYGGDDNAPEFQKDRFDAELKKTSVPLKIQKLQLSDSAVYYCVSSLNMCCPGNTESVFHV